VTTAGATIAKLEALLLRVRARTAEPRAARAAPANAPPAAELQVSSPVEEEEDDQPTIPPPPMVQVAQDQGLPVEVGLAVEERVARAPSRAPESPVQPLESRERLVAAPQFEPAAPEIVADEAPRQVDGAPEIEQVREEEVDEEPPVSSRRPVMPEPEERLAEMAFGAEEPSLARHAPPPESGRLPAAPAAELAAAGGASTEAEVPTRELVPEAIVGQLAASARVADVIGEAQRFAPSSFAALLDASLGL